MANIKSSKWDFCSQRDSPSQMQNVALCSGIFGVRKPLFVLCLFRFEGVHVPNLSQNYSSNTPYTSKYTDYSL